jgi:hypothetical protein
MPEVANEAGAGAASRALPDPRNGPLSADQAREC